MWKGCAGPGLGVLGVSLNKFHSSVAPSFMYWSISPLNCLPLIVCVGGALGQSGGVGVGDAEFRPPTLPCGVGVGEGPGNCVFVVLKRMFRVIMPVGGTMSERNPGIVGN